MTKHDFKDLETRFMDKYPFTYIISKNGDGNKMATLINFDRNCTDTHIKIPSYVNGIRVRIIDEAVFSGSNIESITLPNHLTTIRKNAFYNCKNLKRIEIPDSVRFIHDYVFAYCDKLEKIKWSNNSDCIGVNMFYECKNLKEISNIDNVKEIKRCAFSFSGIESVILPEECISIHRGVFSCCKNLKYVHIPAGLKYIDIDVFKNSENVKLDCRKNKKIREWAIGNNIELYTSELTKFFDDINKDGEKEEVSHCND